MGAAIAIAMQVVGMLPTLGAAVTEGVAFVKAIRVAAKQSGEWTAEQESAFLEALIALSETRAWKTDRELAKG